MGVEHYPEVLLEVTTWYPVTLHRRRLGDIWADENLIDQPTAPCARDYLDLWCKQNTHLAWESTIQTHHVTWLFRDPRDAVRFKLVWGGR